MTTPDKDISIEPTDLDLEDDAEKVQEPDAFEGDSTVGGLGGTDEQAGGAG